MFDAETIHRFRRNFLWATVKGLEHISLQGCEEEYSEFECYVNGKFVVFDVYGTCKDNFRIVSSED